MVTRVLPMTLTTARMKGYIHPDPYEEVSFSPRGIAGSFSNDYQ